VTEVETWEEGIPSPYQNKMWDGMETVAE